MFLKGKKVEKVRVDIQISIQAHYLSILNFFNNTSIKASSESFNAKIKAFRATSKGVMGAKFFLFRLSKRIMFKSCGLCK